MSLKHLFAGIMVGGSALLLGVDPVTVSPGAVTPGYVEEDQIIAKAAQPKRLEITDRAAADCVKDKVQVAECSKALEQVDKPAALETSWTHRLVFPAGNKF